METADKVFKRISQTRALVEASLQRAQNAPYPKSDRSHKIQEVRDAAQAIQDNATQAIHILEGPAREAMEATQAALQERQQFMQELDRQSQHLQQMLAARKKEYQAAIASATARKADASEHPKISEDWNREKSAIELQQAKISADRTQASGEVSELSSQLQREQAAVQRSSTIARQQPPSVDLLSADNEMSAVLERAGVLEREISVGATAQLQQDAKNRIGEKTSDFSEAEDHHRRQASRAFWTMSGAIALSAGIIYFMFVHSNQVELPETASIVSVVASLLHMAIGRIAVLFFLAWIVRYLSILHRVHTAQAVVYRDRKAALGVAGVLLDATPELEQKREMLRALTTAYLSFDRHTFLGTSPSPESRPADRTLEEQLDQLRQVVKTVEPLLTAVGKITRG